jgi:hypothetical protein
MHRFNVVVTGISSTVLVALLVQLTSDKSLPTLLYHGSDPTMPSPLTVGEFGFNSGGEDPEMASSSIPGSGTGCLFVKQSLCDHPVSIDNANLWEKGSYPVMTTFRYNFFSSFDIISSLLWRHSVFDSLWMNS